MTQVLDFLSALLPVWVTFISIAFAYLIFTYKRVLEKRIELGDDMLSKMTNALDITIKTKALYEGEIEMLEKKLNRLEKCHDELLLSININEINLLASPENRLPEHKDSGQSHPIINIANLPGSDILRNKLRYLGFEVYIIKKPIDGDEQEEYDPKEDNVVWIGHNVPSSMISQVIKISFDHWPQLKYIYLTCDVDNTRADIGHNIFVGGSSNGIISRLKLRTWTKADINGFSSSMSNREIHEYIRGTSRNTNLSDAI